MIVETITKNGEDTLQKLRSIKTEIKSESQEVKSVDVCGICNTDEPDEWIQCDSCNNWFHMGCLEDSRRALREMFKFHCARCVPEHGPSIRSESRKRRKTRLNYAALNNGIVQIENTHSHVQYFKAGIFPKAAFPEVTEFTGIYSTPAIVRSPYFSNLGMAMPKNLTPRRVAKAVGEDASLPVMDVVTQNALSGWTIKKWADYFETAPENRPQILNVISLEFTGTPLEKLVKRPTYVAEQDLVDKVWPEDSQLNRPKVKYYCLMGVSGSFTDFHVDFAGTSVFYHVISGRKTFAFVKPTKRNLAAYENWCKRQDQASTFFANLVDECVVVEVKEGDTLIIPSGWIHAVYTPDDSVVIGGNFLTLQDFELQLQIVDIERRTKVPPKFTFPQFRATMWYAASYLLGGEVGDAGEIGSEKLRALLRKYLESAAGAPKGLNSQYILDSL